MLTPADSQRRANELREALSVFVDSPGAVVVTCETCRDNGDCPLAFDAYNTDGDCLAEK